MNTENAKRLHRICFTGHRPEKLNRSEQEIKKDLETEILRAVSDGFDVFITGMARGVDVWAAETVLKLKNNGYDIKLICACPYPKFGENRTKDESKEYNSITERADFIHFVSDGYTPNVFQKRNRWMVDRTARVIAVFNGSDGGTKNTVEYAERTGVPIVFIDG